MSKQVTEFSVGSGTAGFDFDTWSKLAATDANAFEKAKRDLLMQAVAEAPESQRAALTALVEQLMAPVEGATGLDRAVAAHNQMMQSMHSLQNEMLSLKSYVGDAPQGAEIDASMTQFITLTTTPR